MTYLKGNEQKERITFIVFSNKAAFPFSDPENARKRGKAYSFKIKKEWK